MSIYKIAYRFLCRMRGALNVLILYARVRAFPASGGKRTRKAAEPGVVP